MTKRGKPAGGKGLVLRGSLYNFKRKCGHENCKCHRGELHEGPALSYSVNGRMRIITLKDEDVPRVAEALERYRQKKEALEAEALAGLESLRAELAERRSAGGGCK